MDAPALLEVGRVARPHGVQGDVLVAPLTNVPERRFTPGARLRVGGQELEVTAARPHGTRWIVHFAGTDDRTAAEALHGATVEAEPLDDPDVLWVHDLMGARVRTVDGREVGTVVAVEANPADDLLVLDTGALVPIGFVTAATPGEVTIDPPAGLV